MRVVSLCPSLTESVFRLGKGDTLVGRTKFCIKPEDGVASVERVGGTKNPRLDRILALAPDLVLMNEEENRKEDADALVAAGVRVLSTFARDLPGAASSLVAVGELLGASVEARRLADEIIVRATEVAARAANRPRVRFAYLIWKSPLMAVAPGTYINALIEVAGGANVVSAREPRYPEVDAATLAEAERILLSSEPFPFAAKHLAELCAETGLPASRFELVDGELLSWHGAKSLEGLAYAERLFG